MSAAQHKADIAKASPKIAAAIRASLADQRKAVAKVAAERSQRRSYRDATLGMTQADETTKLADALRAAVAVATVIGAGRVAAAVGTDVSDDDEDAATDLAGAMAYKFADQWTSTTFSQLSDLLDSDGDADDWFDSRADSADDAADTLASNAINGGAQDYADSSPAADGATKTWVADDDPCPDCDIDGETVGADEDFSNGAPQPPMHANCTGCTVEWTAAADSSDDEDRSQRSTMTTRATLTTKERNALDDSDFAYVDSDGDGHLPIQDAAHVKAAMGGNGWSAQEFETPADKTAAAKKIIAAAKKLDIEVDPTTDIAKAAGVKAPESKFFRFDVRPAPATSHERREQSMSFGNIQSALYTAITAALPFGSDIWIQDAGPDWVVWHSYGLNGSGDFQVSYSMDPDTMEITFTGPIEEVAQVTTWVPGSGSTTEMAEIVGRSTRAAKGTDGNGDGMVTCPTCEGKGTIMEGNRKCPDCGGDGKVTEGSKVLETKSRRPRYKQRRDLQRHSERRVFSAPIEVRSAAMEGDEAVLVGTPIRYDTPYQVRDMFGVFRETMRPGVVDAVLARDDLDVRFLFNHAGTPMARTTNGTLTATSTPEGVECEARIDTRRSDCRDLALAVERSDVSQMSCGFVVADDGDQWNEDYSERDVFSFGELFDFSAVTYPASTTTSVELAQRMLMGVSSETRERIRNLYHLAKALRAGAMISQQNGQDLADALEALHEADDIDIPQIVKDLQTIDSALDAGQAGLAAVLGRANPDGDPGDLEPALVPPGDDQRAMQRQLLAIIRAKELLAV